MTNSQYKQATAALIGVWFIFSIVASSLRLFQADPSRPPLALGLSILIPIALFAAWFATSAGFRQFALNLSPRSLTLVQSWRVAGYAFLVLYTYNILPGLFALPAGWGDVFIGLTAPFAAMSLANPAHRRSFIFWQILGITDLVSAVTLGSLAFLIAPQGIPTSPNTVLPLSLIPTFAVPLMLILHVICIAQATRWPAQSPSRVAEQLPSAAV